VWLTLASDPGGIRTRDLRLERAATTPHVHWADQCAGQELNLQSPKAGGLRPPRLANAQPTRKFIFTAKGGSRTRGVTKFGHRLAWMPVGRSSLFQLRTLASGATGFRPPTSSSTGRRAEPLHYDAVHR
jgi:hypothetical protein